MSYVTITYSAGPAASGNYLFTASGVLAGLDGGIVTPVVSGQLDDTGSFSVQLEASSDYTPGLLTWDVRLTVNDEITVNFPGMEVMQANGDSQDLIACLEASGFTPTPLP